MNIVVSGSRVQIYGEDVKTYKNLPVDTYDVCFHKMMGFWLTPRAELEAKEEKIYGNHEVKVNKVLNSFAATDRNFGIILSGQKGIGKSLFARILAEKCIANNIAVIIVSQYIPGIADFLASIEQEVCVIFDEFEKTFGRTEDIDPQEEMLSLFDGIDNGKKLFVITCNEVNKLNSYLVNRPGRFHYHFSITNPSEDEVREYMTDKILPQYGDAIEKIVNFSKTINITYDYLRALAFEINQGYSLEETLNDLNITRTEDIRFNVIITLSDNTIYKAYEQRFDLYSKNSKGLRAYSNKEHGGSIWVSFCPSDVAVKNGQLILDPSKIRVSLEEDDYWDLDDDERKAALEKDKARMVKSCVFEKQNFDFVTRYCV